MGIVGDVECGRKTVEIVLVQLTRLLAKSIVCDVQNCLITWTSILVLCLLLRLPLATVCDS